MADDILNTLKLPPHSIEAEQSLLGGLLIENEALDKIADLVSPSDFYRQDHRLLLNLMSKTVQLTLSLWRNL